MAPARNDDDWSDSDEEDPSEVETNVLLGVPDGNIDVDNDVIDAAVSRIGGLPAFLPSREPPFSSSHCKSCSEPMELLVQMWCPFEDSPMDRAIYIWGCARSGCQGKVGSVRAWRGLRYNDKYAIKLERKRQKKIERERSKAKADEEKARHDAQQKNTASSQANPFSMGGGDTFGGPKANIFNLGAQIFGAESATISPFGVEKAAKTVADPTLTNTHDNPTGEGDSDHDEDASDADSEASLLTALASTTVGESKWRSAPSYPPLYLSTVAEYLPPQAKPRLPKDITVEDLRDDDKKEKDLSWIKETYEDSLEVDQIFERFTKRVAVASEQCVRYELKGVPLPFVSDKTFDLLWPLPPQDPLPVTKPDFKVVRPQRRVYDTSAVPNCPECKSARTFECQLMPNLINVLRPTWEEKGKNKKLSDEERRKAVDRALKGLDKELKKGMDWGTCMVFSCDKDCCVEDGKEVKEAWREEVVYIQWDV